MRFPIRLAWLLLLLVAAGPALAQTAAPPQRPFGQLVELWTRQLDRIATRAEQASLLPVEIDALREQAGEVRAAAAAAANFARGDLADTRKLLAPLEAKPASDAVPESDAVKADRERLTEQAAVSEGRVKQCEVVIARADQLIERLTKLRGEVMLRTLLRRDASPLSRDVWSKLGPELGASLQTLSTATRAWLGAGLQFRGPRSCRPGRLGHPHRAAVGRRPLPAPPLRPRRGGRARPARPHRHRRDRRRRPGAGADPGGLADRQASVGDHAAIADRRPAARADQPGDHLPAGRGAHRHGAVAASPGVAHPALHQSKRAGTVAGAAPPDGGRAQRRLHLRRPDAQRRRGRRGVGGRRSRCWPPSFRCSPCRRWAIAPGMRPSPRARNARA